MKVIVPVTVGFPGVSKEYHIFLDMTNEEDTELESNVAEYTECHFGTIVGMKVPIVDLPDSLRDGIDKQIHALIFKECSIHLGSIELKLRVGDKLTRLPLRSDVDKFEALAEDLLMGFMMDHMSIDNEYAIVTLATDFAF